MSPTAKRRTYRILAAIGLLALILLPLALSGCVTDADGNTRLDADGLSRATGTALDAYERLRQAREPQPVMPPGAPFPVYPPQGH